MLVTARPLFLALSLALTVISGTLPRALAQGPSDGATPPEERVLNQLSAARSTGIGGAFTSSPDGSVLFLAEGGSLGVIDDTSDANLWESLTKSVPIGSEWLVPTAMALDPDATEPYDESDAEDRLYIAAGRMGLWVMEADQTDTHLDLAVARIDDAPATSPADQSAAAGARTSTS